MPLHPPWEKQKCRLQCRRLAAISLPEAPRDQSTKCEPRTHAAPEHQNRQKRKHNIRSWPCTTSDGARYMSR
jgi:hypothetical protein